MKEINKTVRLFEHSLAEVPAPYQPLLETAREAAQSSYSPYSNFPVGTALLLEDGTMVQGSNQENAAYPSGLCAERTALFYKGARYPSVAIKAIAIYVSKAGEAFPFPCGGCLQAMVEFESRQSFPFDIILIHPDADKVLIGKGVENFIPFSFRKEHLQA